MTQTGLPGNLCPEPTTDPSGTTSAEPPPDRRRARRVVRDKGELVAAVPTLVGFHPQSSVLLITLRGPRREIDLVVRSDLPDPEGEERSAAFVEQLVDSAMRAEPDSVAVVVVTDRLSGPPPPWADLVALVVDRLDDRGVDTDVAVCTAGTRSGDRWMCYQPCRCGGPVPASAASGFAAEAVWDGIVVHADRDVLAGLVAPVPADRLDRRERLLVAELDRLAATGSTPDPATGWAVVAAALAAAGHGGPVLDDDDVVALAVALGLPEVRDAAIAHLAAVDTSGDRQEAGAAERLWAVLTRETPVPEAAVPATLLATAALLRGDGALANVALDRAESAWPGYLIARQTRAVAAAGIRPADLRATLRGAHRKLR